MSLEALRKELTRQRISGRTAAEILKVSPSTFWRITNGTRLVTAKSAAAAAAYLRNREGAPPALVPTSTRPRRADYRLTLEAEQIARLERLGQDIGQEPHGMLQSLASVLLWPGAPSVVRNRFFRMVGR